VKSTHRRRRQSAPPPWPRLFLSIPMRIGKPRHREEEHLPLPGAKGTAAKPFDVGALTARGTRNRRRGWQRPKGTVGLVLFSLAVRSLTVDGRKGREIEGKKRAPPARGCRPSPSARGCRPSPSARRQRGLDLLWPSPRERGKGAPGCASSTAAAALSSGRRRRRTGRGTRRPFPAATGGSNGEREEGLDRKG
jgi:hypothetical protein